MREENTKLKKKVKDLQIKFSRMNQMGQEQKAEAEGEIVDEMGLKDMQFEKLCNNDKVI